MKTGLFEITLSRKKGNDECDNWRVRNVFAKTAMDAIKKIELSRRPLEIQQLLAVHGRLE